MPLGFGARADRNTLQYVGIRHGAGAAHSERAFRGMSSLRPLCMPRCAAGVSVRIPRRRDESVLVRRASGRKTCRGDAGGNGRIRKPEPKHDGFTEGGFVRAAFPFRVVPRFGMQRTEPSLRRFGTDRFRGRLFRRFLVEVVGDERIDDVRDPYRDGGRQQATFGELLAELADQNEREGQHDAHADVQPRASPHFA